MVAPNFSLHRTGDAAGVPTAYIAPIGRVLEPREKAETLGCVVSSHNLGSIVYSRRYLSSPGWLPSTFLWIRDKVQRAKAITLRGKWHLSFIRSVGRREW